MMSILDLLRPLQFRGKRRLLLPWINPTGLRAARLFGYRMNLEISGWIERTIYLGCYEPLNTYLFKKILRPGMTVVDVGANIGYFTLLSARMALHPLAIV